MNSFLEEPASTESCDKVHGMLTINYKPFIMEEV